MVTTNSIVERAIEEVRPILKYVTPHKVRVLRSNELIAYATVVAREFDFVVITRDGRLGLLSTNNGVFEFEVEFELIKEPWNTSDVDAFLSGLRRLIADARADKLASADSLGKRLESLDKLGAPLQKTDWMPGD